MNQRPRYLGDLFHRIVWMLAVPVAGCGSTVASPGTPDAGADAGVDVGAATDRPVSVDAGYDAGPPPIDIPAIDVPGPDVPRVDAPAVDAPSVDAPAVDAPAVDAPPGDVGCEPRSGGDIPGTCEEAVLFPCGLPPEAQVEAGSYLPGDLCTTLCAATRFGGGSSCRRVEPLADGTERIGCMTCAIGRRTEGLGAIEGATEAGPLGDFFARVATLEWASVTAFERLADDLAGLGAPVRAPEFTPAGKRTLEAIAVENAAEGCVRETFGALVATWQARAARDAAVADALREVAADETRHAEFSWALQRWVDATLDAAALARVHAAHDEAAAALWSELDGAVDPALVTVAGMPDRDTARALFAAMTAALA